jgi:serpin B
MKKNLTLSLLLVGLFCFSVPFIAQAFFDENLHYGMKYSQAVKDLQAFLTSQNLFPGLITGNLFSLARQAVKDFQELEGMVTTGFWAPLIMSKINQIISSNQQLSNQKADDLGATTAGVNSVVGANNQFASDLYNVLKDNQNNVFFSPFSISSAFAMVYEGANGQTANEIDNVFHFPTDSATRRSSFAKLYNDMNTGNTYYNLSIANALWAEKRYSFLDNYKNIIQQYYLGNTTNLDFINATESSRQTINNWVANRTHNKIMDLMPRRSIDQTTKLVLTDAVYFKGTWQRQFDAKNTSSQNFTTTSGSTTKVHMMCMAGKNSNFKYVEDSNLQAIELPYKGNKLSMVILLPKGNNLSLAEEYLDPQKLAQLKNSFAQKQVNLFVPKFKLETDYADMADTLSNMGMPIAFSDRADFSGMDGIGGLKISKVIHKAYIDVDEEGTEAAGATGVVMMPIAVAMPETPVVFRADHPFIFLIQDNSAENILFLGSILDPKQ